MNNIINGIKMLKVVCLVIMAVGFLYFLPHKIVAACDNNDQCGTGCSCIGVIYGRFCQHDYPPWEMYDCLKAPGICDCPGTQDYQCWRCENNSCKPYSQSWPYCQSNCDTCGGGTGNPPPGGPSPTAVPTPCVQYSATPLKDEIKFNTAANNPPRECVITINHLGWDLDYARTMGWLNLNNGIGFRQIAMNDSFIDFPCKHNRNLDFTNFWSLSGDHKILWVQNLINAEDAYDPLASGWRVDTTNGVCYLNSYGNGNWQGAEVRNSSVGGSVARNYNILFCGDGICSTPWETPSNCLADCRPPPQPIQIKVEDDTGTGISGAGVNGGHYPCEGLIGKFTMNSDGKFTTPLIVYGSPFCLRGETLAGYLGPYNSYECQIAGYFANPADGCGNTPGQDEPRDDAFVIKYRRAIPTFVDNFFKLRNSVGSLGTLVEAEAGARNQSCQTVFTQEGVNRHVRFEVTATDRINGNNISDIRFKLGNNEVSMVSKVVAGQSNWSVDGSITSQVSGNSKTVVFPMLLSANLNSPVLYDMSVLAANEVGFTSPWTDTGRDFKIWDCDVPVSGSMYDSSAVAFGGGCSVPGTFTTKADKDMNFKEVYIRQPAEQGRTVITPDNDSDYSGGSIRLTWGKSYIIEPGLLNASGPKTRWIDMGVGGTGIQRGGCDPQNNLINIIDAYNNSPSLKVDFAAIKNQDPWYQVVGGGIQSKTKIGDMVPITCALNPTLCQAGIGISAPGLNNGLISAPTISNDSGCNQTQGCLIGRPKDWWIKSNTIGKRYDYQYFYNNYYANKGVGYTISNSTTMTSILGNTDIGGTGVIFVNGDLDIDKDNTVGVGKFLMLVVLGDINIEPSVNQVQGIYMANGDITASGTSETQLKIEGMLMSGGNINLSRGYLIASSNNTSPATVVTYRPEFLFTIPSQLSKILTNWKEGR